MLGEIVGNFRIVARLGRGGMGEVWLAEQLNIGTRVAIKVLLDPVTPDSDEVQRFFNEARAVSRIQHAGIAKIFDVGIHPSGRAYLVMELLEGETIGRRISRAGRMGLPELGDLGRQVASVLAATHGAGITHRDLKPENVFVVPDREQPRGERAKVLDFGIAKLSGTLAGESPRTTGMLGTPAYMAPEQWGDSSIVDWRVDIYSLGCLLFEMACGRPPFVVTTVAEACAKHLYDVPPRACAIEPELPPELDRLIAAMLEKRPDKRPQSMDEVARALEAAASGVDSSAPTVGFDGKNVTTAAMTRRIKPVSVAVGAAIALGIAATGGYWVATRKAQVKADEVASRDAGAAVVTPIAAATVDAGVVAPPDAAVVAIAPVPPTPAHPGGAHPASPSAGGRPKSTSGKPAPGNLAGIGDRGKNWEFTRTDPGDAPEGKIDANEVERLLRAHMPDYTACIQPHVNADPTTTGRLVVTFRIDTGGRAFEMSATGLTDAISGCVMGQIRRIIFPRPVGNPVKIIFPIAFDTPRGRGVPDPPAPIDPSLPPSP